MIESSATSTMPKKSGLSKRNKAVIEQSKAAGMRREKIQSSVTGTMPNRTGLSRRNKTVLKQEEAYRKMQKRCRQTLLLTAMK